MLHSVSEVGSDLLDKHDQAVEKKIRQKKKWGPFQFFLIVSSVLVLVMWGVIIFGGQAAPKGTVEFAKKGRVLLFMVNGALARYARYEGNKYPETLSALVPKYLAFKDPDLVHLRKLSYQKDPVAGYRLSLINPEKGEMNLILSPKGIEHIPSSGRGA